MKRKPIPAWQHSQLETLTRCAWGELHSRRRYIIGVTCRTCKTRPEPLAWIAEAIRWIADHLHHRTSVRVRIDPMPKPEPSGIEARTEAQRQSVYDAIGIGQEATLKEIGTITGLLIDTLRRRLAELEREGWITRASRSGRANVYMANATQN